MAIGLAMAGGGAGGAAARRLRFLGMGVSINYFGGEFLVSRLVEDGALWSWGMYWCSSRQLTTIYCGSE